jgi:hypothetical protein
MEFCDVAIVGGGCAGIVLSLHPGRLLDAGIHIVTIESLAAGQRFGDAVGAPEILMHAQPLARMPLDELAERSPDVSCRDPDPDHAARNPFSKSAGGGSP